LKQKCSKAPLKSERKNFQNTSNLFFNDLLKLKILVKYFIIYKHVFHSKTSNLIFFHLSSTIFNRSFNFTHEVTFLQLLIKSLTLHIILHLNSVNRTNNIFLLGHETTSVFFVKKLKRIIWIASNLT
jgi:hypothetical protein